MSTRINALTTGTPSDSDFFAFDGSGGTKKVSKKTLYEAVPVSRPNLLRNGWFQVDQRGIGSTGKTVTGAEYTIDGWKAQYCTIKKTADGCRFISTDGTNRKTLMQYLGFDWSERPATYTLSILAKVNSVSGSAALCFAYGNSIAGSVALTATTGYQIFTVTADMSSRSGLAWILLRVNNTSSDAIDVDIKAIKLEVGAYSTLQYDILPDYETELERCQRYFYKINGLSTGKSIGVMMASATTGGYFFLPLPVKMANAPELILDAISDIGMTASTSSSGVACTSATVNRLEGAQAVLNLRASGFTVGGVLAVYLAAGKALALSCEASMEA